jgi:uncharacterized membrane protein YdbT with pleckstrin-like domain
MKSVHLHPGEKIVAEVRNHWFIFMIESLGVFIAALLPLVLIYLLITISDIIISPALFYIGLSAYLFWLLFVWTYFFVAWTDYYLDVWVITDKKIIDFKQKGLFHREIGSFRLDKIQDVTIETSGFIATMLKFGRLHIHTAVDGHHFFLSHAAQPEEAKGLILKLAHEAEATPEDALEPGPPPAATDQKGEA